MLDFSRNELVYEARRPSKLDWVIFEIFDKRFETEHDKQGLISSSKAHQETPVSISHAEVTLFYHGGEIIISNPFKKY